MPFFKSRKSNSTRAERTNSGENTEPVKANKRDISNRGSRTSGLNPETAFPKSPLPSTSKKINSSLLRAPQIDDEGSSNSMRNRRSFSHRGSGSSVSLRHSRTTGSEELGMSFPNSPLPGGERGGSMRDYRTSLDSPKTPLSNMGSSRKSIKQFSSPTGVNERSGSMRMQRSVGGGGSSRSFRRSSDLDNEMSFPKSPLPGLAKQRSVSGGSKNLGGSISNLNFPNSPPPQNQRSGSISKKDRSNRGLRAVPDLDRDNSHKSYSMMTPPQENRKSMTQPNASNSHLKSAPNLSGSDDDSIHLTDGDYSIHLTDNDTSNNPLKAMIDAAHRASGTPVYAQQSMMHASCSALQHAPRAPSLTQTQRLHQSFSKSYSRSFSDDSLDLNEGHRSTNKFTIGTKMVLTKGMKERLAAEESDQPKRDNLSKQVSNKEIVEELTKPIHSKPTVGTKMVLTKGMKERFQALKDAEKSDEFRVETEAQRATRKNEERRKAVKARKESGKNDEDDLIGTKMVVTKGMKERLNAENEDDESESRPVSMMDALNRSGLLVFDSNDDERKEDENDDDVSELASDIAASSHHFLAEPSSLFPKNSLCTASSALCLGTGRFLRSVLAPALVAANYHPILVQTRGRSFMDYCRKDSPESVLGNDSDRDNNNQWTYDIDTVHFDGTVETTSVPCWGAGTLGTPEGKMDVLELCSTLGINSDSDEKEPKPLIIGVGVTEAGLANASTKAMHDLYDVLEALSHRKFQQTIQWICVINTDNVPKNGDVLKKFMNEIAQANEDEVMLEFLADFVVFHNTMVDRIVSQRPNSNGLVPQAEPTPFKALVIEDLGNALPQIFRNDTLRKDYGVVVRNMPGMLDADIALKLRVANGTHTAAAHAMALTGLTMTDVLSSNSDDAKLLMKYLDSFFDHQILKGVKATQEFKASASDAQAVYDDWRRRLIHAHFGLSSFFITQNGAAKGGIRIGPTIKDLILSQKSNDAATPLTCATAFALAALLRFLTEDPASKSDSSSNVFRGALDQERIKNEAPNMYADGLEYDLLDGLYDFRCACNIAIDGGKEESPLPKVLAKIGDKMQPLAYEPAVRAYLCKPDGGNMESVSDTLAFGKLVKAVSTLYARMRGGDSILGILRGLDLRARLDSLVDGPCYDVGVKGYDGNRPLHYQQHAIPDHSKLMDLPVRHSTKNYRHLIKAVVFAEVASAKAIDLHTHLMPPTHGTLCLWGIDELLTYHYLVAEYFVTAPPSVTPESFYALSKREQADLIWQALFVERSPVSEACRGVITTCVALGLSEKVEERDLEGIRAYYRTFRERGIEGAESFSRHVYHKAGIDYAVMTNIPFEPTETQHWKPTPKEYSKHFRSACRVDPLLAGNTAVIEQSLKSAGYDTTLEGARKFLHDWCDIMKPEYLMASTPHDFVLPEDEGTAGGPIPKIGVNEEAMKEPFAFASASANANSCAIDCGPSEELASVINEDSDFLSDVLMKVCEERDLPLALKIGAHRGVNPKLQQAGDGVVAFADASMLARLCTRFPKVRFLATFLSRANQHEACVLASKFRNLHLYGCWWFCNNPSIIKEITKMRIEMLGTAFTAQHSDSRVLDQLLYKWPHSRAVLAEVIAKEYIKLVETGGWSITRRAIRKDVWRWFRGSYEEFMSKSLV